jgi:ATP synthase protein I
MSQGDQEHMWRLAGRYSAIGIEIAASVAFGTFGGIWLDRHLGTSPLFLILGLIVGTGAAVVGVLRVVRSARLDKL